MKLGPLVIQVEVSRDPCQCGAAPTTVTIPVTVKFSARMTDLGVSEAPPPKLYDLSRCTLIVDGEKLEHQAKSALTCKRCEA